MTTTTTTWAWLWSAALCATVALVAAIVFVACFAERPSASSGARVVREGLAVKKAFGKAGKAIKKTAAKATSAVKSAVAPPEDDAAQPSSAAEERDPATGDILLRIPRQPNNDEVARALGEQLQFLSKVQVMEIAKKAKEVINEINDTEQKLEDELNKA